MADERRAAQRYCTLVNAGRDVRLWDEALRQHIYLDDEKFVKRMQALANLQQVSRRDVPKAQRSMPLTLAQWLDTTESRDEALLWAHTKSGISMTAMAAELHCSVSYVSRLIKRAQAAFETKQGI